MRRAIKHLLAVTLLMTISAVFGLLSPASAAELSSVLDNNAVQTDGTVWSVLLKGNRIYLGGSFEHVNGVSRPKLAAINANTGALTAWNPRTNGRVLALAAPPDGSRIYAGGSFTSVNGTPRNHLVALDAATGGIDTAWKAEANNTVFSLATLGDRVYFGGHFTSVNGEQRARLAAVNGVTGVLDPNWAPTADGNVRTLVVSPDKSRIYAGGNYSSISGESRPGLAALNPTTGAVLSWIPDPRGDNNYEVFDLEVTNNRVFVAGGGRSPDGTAEAFNASTGASVWRYTSSGDFQAVALLDGKVYFGGHFITLFTRNGEIHRNKFMAVNAGTGALDARWTPKANAGVWAMTPDPLRIRVYAGGAFTLINNEPRQGFAQFSSR
jgi:outer membrane protein assembly factor BamB